MNSPVISLPAGLRQCGASQRIDRTDGTGRETEIENGNGRTDEITVIRDSFKVLLSALAQGALVGAVETRRVRPQL